ncbi:MAG: hypothetical protein P8047_16150 [Gammaproteobacteria bacterium]|jgi:hypothetical protein
MKPQTPQSQRESRAVWVKRYEKWQSSGQSKADFCRQHGIKASNFYFWCAVLRKDPPSVVAPSKNEFYNNHPPSFVPISIRDSSPLLTLQCADVTLSCSAMISTEQLTQWIKALRSAACSP